MFIVMLLSLWFPAVPHPRIYHFLLLVLHWFGQCPQLEK